MALTHYPNTGAALDGETEILTARQPDGLYAAMLTRDASEQCAGYGETIEEALEHLEIAVTERGPR